MDRTDHIRVFGHKAIADLRSVVLRGTIVNEDDLDIVAQGQQRVHAFFHIVCRVEARHGKGDYLHL